MPPVARESGGVQRRKLHAHAPTPAEHFVASVSAVAKSVTDQGVVDGRTMTALKQREVVRRLPDEIATLINPRGALVKDLNEGPVRTLPGPDPLQPTTGPREAHSQQGGWVGCGDVGVGHHADIAVRPVVGQDAAQRVEVDSRVDVQGGAVQQRSVPLELLLLVGYGAALASPLPQVPAQASVSSVTSSRSSTSPSSTSSSSLASSLQSFNGRIGYTFCFEVRIYRAWKQKVIFVFNFIYAESTISVQRKNTVPV